MQFQLIESLVPSLTQVPAPGALCLALASKVYGTSDTGHHQRRTVRHDATSSLRHSEPAIPVGTTPGCSTAATLERTALGLPKPRRGLPKPAPFFASIADGSLSVRHPYAAATASSSACRRSYSTAAAAMSPSAATGAAATTECVTAAATAAAVSVAPPPPPPPPPMSFSNYRAVFEGQTSWQLLRAYAVLRVCSFKALVSNAEILLSTCRRLLGDKVTDTLVKTTFFAHFCAGEDVSEVQRTVDRLHAVGVGAILDYAAEDDVGPTSAAASASASAKTSTTASDKNSSSSSSSSSTGGPLGQNQGPAVSWASAAAVSAAAAGGGLEVQPSTRALGVVGRTYDYASEEQCDRHVDHFLSAIEMAARQPSRPAFAAVKVTALGNPALLQRASTAVSLLHGLFKRFDEDGSGFIDRDEFQRQWRRLVGAGGDTAVLSRQADDTFRWLDTEGTGKVDYVSWCQRLDLRHMPILAARIAEAGGGVGEDEAGAAVSGQTALGGRAVANACLDGQEVELMDVLLGRLQRLVAASLRHDVRLMIDAEHTYFQPAIDHVTLQLMRQHNRAGAARVLNTYQAYLVNSRSRLLRDMERAKREGWVLGAKLVRGAYLHLERRRAEALGLPSPVWPKLELTHANYDACVADLLGGVRKGRAEVLLGTHNQSSVEAAVGLMGRLGLAPAAAPGTPGVMFGQLLGMSDHLTLTLGKAGYRAYKYVPYGRVSQVMPYLLRRAAENQDIMKGSKQDLVMLRSELRRRTAAAVGLSSGPTGLEF